MSLKPFPKGHSGNPAGRPKGSRNKLSEAFVDALYADWQASGPAAIVKVREEKPEAYLRVIAQLVPRDFNVKVNDPFDELSDEQIALAIQELDRSIRATREQELAAMDEASPTAH